MLVIKLITNVAKNKLSNVPSLSCYSQLSFYSDKSKSL